MKRTICKAAASTVLAVGVVFSSATPALADTTIEVRQPNGRVQQYLYSGDAQPSQDYVRALQDMTTEQYWMQNLHRRVEENAAVVDACTKAGFAALFAESVQKINKKTAGTSGTAFKLVARAGYVSALLCAQVAYIIKDDEYYKQLHTEKYRLAMERVCSIPVQPENQLCNCWEINRAK